MSDQLRKCAFPTDKINKYTKLFNFYNLKFEVIEQLSAHRVHNQENYLEQLKNLDLSNTTPIECFNIINNIQKKLKGS